MNFGFMIKFVKSFLNKITYNCNSKIHINKI